MPTLDDVYRKFGQTAEAAQLLETQLGNDLFFESAVGEGLLERQNPTRAQELLDRVNSQTFGQLLTRLKAKGLTSDEVAEALTEALNERNRLFHNFYRQHNFRRNSDAGRALMMQDLDAMHEALIRAYKLLLLLSGVDIDALPDGPYPDKHLPI